MGGVAGSAIANPPGPAVSREVQATGPRSVGEAGDGGEEWVAPVFSGLGLLPVPTAQEIAEARGKKKVVEFDGLGPKDEELSFADQEGWWADPGADGPGQNWVADPRVDQTGRPVGPIAGRTSTSEPRTVGPRLGDLNRVELGRTDPNWDDSHGAAAGVEPGAGPGAID
ncbi:unnamed protein product [Linum trigynum]|uniref:Uncharacterized protein n=1 Tax=Linum trigynum TaxID=586398 RepID=A0AAV2G894_9ROSI